MTYTILQTFHKCIIVLFLTLGFFFLKTSSISACDPNTLTLDPPILVTADIPLSFSISGCNANSRYNIFTEVNDETLDAWGAWEFYSNNEGVLSKTIANFIPFDGHNPAPINYPATINLLIYQGFDEIARTSFSIIGPRPTPFVQCGERVPRYFDGCPFYCSSATDYMGNWFCGGPTPIPTPTPTPRPTCAITALVGKTPNWGYDQNNVYAISIFINSQTLPSGDYRLHIYNGIPGPGGDYVTKDLYLTPNTTTPVVIGDNLDSGYAGQTHTLTLEGSWCNYADTRCIICDTRITFPTIAQLQTEEIPVIDPYTVQITPPPLPPTPNPTPTSIPRDPREVNLLFYIRDCTNQTISGQTFGPNTSIMTSIGCIGGNIGNIFAFFLRLAIGIAGGIAFLLIIIGGLRIILSSGIPEGMNEGKEIVTSAIVGLLLIIFSVFILRFIGVDILKIPGFS